MAKRIRKHKASGLTVRSGFEAKIVEQLRERGVKFEYETLKLKYVVPEKTHTYTPDVILPNGVILEIKGRLTAADRAKMLAVKRCNPELDIRFVFMRDNFLSRASKTKYSQWAEKNGFLWCIKEITDEWTSQ